MAILGLTNDEHGQALQRLPVVVKVAIGLGPDNSKGRKAPQKLDHFIFQSRSTTAESGWDADLEITKKMGGLYGVNGDGSKLREFEIVFLDDDIENVLRTNLAWWTQSACQCRGELVQVENGSAPKFEMRAIRRTERAPEGEPWPGGYKYSNGDKKGQPVEACGEKCPDFIDGRCKPACDVFFIPYKLPVLGATWKIDELPTGGSSGAQAAECERTKVGANAEPLSTSGAIWHRSDATGPIPISDAIAQPMRLVRSDESTAHYPGRRIEPRNSSVQPVSGVSCASHRITTEQIVYTDDERYPAWVPLAIFLGMAISEAWLAAHYHAIDMIRSWFR